MTFIHPYILLLCLFFVVPTHALKLLHLSFHTGCITAVDTMAKDLNIDVTHWFMLEKPEIFAPLASGGDRYNITHKLAKHIWKQNKSFFDQFDAILTSDTGPLARIFLQNNWKKPLIIWICNRFDYFDSANKRDQEFYTLFKEATKKNNVTIVNYTPFEQIYALSKGVPFPNLTIKPYTTISSEKRTSMIPSTIDPNETFFIPPYHNDTIFMNLSKKCTNLGIKNYTGRYNGAADLKNFKGIIHIPYAWSNLALFENIAYGIPYFIPSFEFMKKLRTQGNFWHQDAHLFFDVNITRYSEWYCDEHKEILTYFDSWEELAALVKNTDFDALRTKILVYAEKHKTIMYNRWKSIFDAVN